MIIVSPATDAIFSGRSMIVAARVTATLPGGASVYNSLSMASSGITIDYQNNTDAPEGSSYAPGYGARTASVTFSGVIDARNASRTAAWLFSRYPRKDSTGAISPLWQKQQLMIPVVIDLGVVSPTDGGIQWIRKFTGEVDDVTVEPRTGDVTMTLMDNRAKLRTNVSTPPVVTAPPYNAGLTNEFAFDYLLRRSSAGAFGTWPAVRPQCLLAVGFRTSMWAEVGTFATNTSRAPIQFVSGVNGSALSQVFTDVSQWANSAALWSLDSASSSSDFTFEFWVSRIRTAGQVNLFGLPTSGSGGPFIEVAGGASSVKVSAGYGTGTNQFSVTTASAWGDEGHYIGVHIHCVPGSTSWNVDIRIDNVTSSASGTLTVARGTTPTDTLALNMFGTTSGSTTVMPTIEALQMTTETSPTWNDSFVPQAVLDPSLNALTVIPAISGDPWQAMTDMAKSENGLIEFDDNGIFRFHNRHRIRRKQSVRTIYGGQIGDYASLKSMASLRNRVSCSYFPWSFLPSDFVYKLDHPIKIAAGRDKVFTVKLTQDLVTQLDTSMTVYPDGSSAVASSFRASNDAYGNSEFTGRLIWTLEQVGSGRVRITVHNSSGRDAYLVSPFNYLDVTAGTPFFQLVARPVVAGDPVLLDEQWPPKNPFGTTGGGAVSGPYGREVRYDFPDNQWIQDPDSAQTMVIDNLSHLCNPKGELQDMPVFPNFLMQVTDRYHLIAPGQMDDYVTLWAWNISIAAGSLAMKIGVRAVTDPSTWILGVAGRSELGVTTFI